MSRLHITQRFCSMFRSSRLISRACTKDTYLMPLLAFPNLLEGLMLNANNFRIRRPSISTMSIVYMKLLAMRAWISPWCFCSALALYLSCSGASQPIVPFGPYITLNLHFRPVLGHAKLITTRAAVSRQDMPSRRWPNSRW
ncbi:hypothetical protein BV22DRAFT_110910 [Leucogyrophana mollusca]|uniref:Uncharacterized protein n=1 Tax=Leucogyrophana mollusca TaxID=85980 RepID=A0ACB8BWE1_9AGAM|nr:hypothetical protein BV22DRAFT_110910 [Leucogyrophana mollusca]